MGVFPQSQAGCRCLSTCHESRCGPYGRWEGGIIMGIHLIKMPDIGEGIAEVELVEWHVQPGDNVVEDQLLADVMTDKATVQVPSPVQGKVLALGGKVGEVMAVGSALIARKSVV